MHVLRSADANNSKRFEASRPGQGGVVVVTVVVLFFELAG
jgi:hypothetical protein